MNLIKSQKTLSNLLRERALLMVEYADCIKSGNVYELKNKILERMSNIEAEIKKFERLYHERVRY